MRFCSFTFLLLILGWGCVLDAESNIAMKMVTERSSVTLQKHVLLLGASIGKAWNIPSLDERIHTEDFTFEYIHGGGFDKSKALTSILSRRKNKPDAIFIKECAAWFPGDFQHYKKLMKQWITECHQANVVPIPTTVVPVTRLHSLKKFLIDILKGRNPFKYGSPFSNSRNRAILEYNNWIRTYCHELGLSVLDLEKAVCYSEKNRFLREDLAKLDGLHINTKAYSILDQIVISALKTVKWTDKNAGKTN